MSAEPIRKSSAIFTFPMDPPLSPLDLENRIECIDAEEIRVLAQKIVTCAMMVLAIDIETPKAQSFRTKFETKSKMLSCVDPITEQIAKSLTEVSSFAEGKPIQIDLMNGENTGVFDQVTDEVLKPYLVAAKEECMKYWNVDKLSSFASLVSLNLEKSTRELHFGIKMSVNDRPLGKESGTLADFAEHFKNGLT